MIDLDASRTAVAERIGRNDVGCAKLTEDLERYWLLFDRFRTLVETGSATGNFARWAANCGLTVWSVDSLARGLVGHADLHFELADSADWLSTHPVPGALVSLDSDHYHLHVARELAACEYWAGYIVVEDTLFPEYQLTALIDRFLSVHPEWERDVYIEEQSPVTGNPGGWLKRR